ncbi:MAG: hypothetical protein NUV46_02600 [Nanoarchaeota archaeon]|nr:hypothetical protein [Nanoarchaeota archaeon]
MFFGFVRNEKESLKNDLDCIDCTFRETNESLEAILYGMKIEPRDSVLGIMGSGQQGLAMVARGAKVTLFDYNEGQVRYFKKILDFLKNKKNSDADCVEPILGFDPSPRHSPKNFFSNIENVKSIRQNIENLNFFEPVNLSKLSLQYPNYNKVYLSNALTYGGMNYSFSEFKEWAKPFNSQTLFYLSKPLHDFPSSDPSFYFERRLSRKSKKFEDSIASQWDPEVIIKK